MKYEARVIEKLFLIGVLIFLGMLIMSPVMIEAENVPNIFTQNYSLFSGYPLMNFFNSSVINRTLTENALRMFMDQTPVMFNFLPLGADSFSLLQKPISPMPLLTAQNAYSLFNLNSYMGFTPSSVNNTFFSAPITTNDIYSYNRRYNDATNDTYNYTNNVADYSLFGGDRYPSVNKASFNNFESSYSNYSFFSNQLQIKRPIIEPKPVQIDIIKLEYADVRIDENYDGEKTIILNEGETLSILLASNVTTGYRWELNADKLDNKVIEQKNAQYLSGVLDENELLLGAGGYEQWIFQAIGVGATTIELNYKQSWSTDIVDTFTVEVTVQPSEGLGGQTEIANPASVYCIENGGILEIRTNELGSYGVCIFSDGSECDEWAYFRGECGK